MPILKDIEMTKETKEPKEIKKQLIQMSNKKTKEKPVTEVGKSPAKPNVEYLSEAVKNYAFSDHVEVQSFPRGMLFSFAKFHPKTSDVIIFDEILIPFEVAKSLSEIIKGQFDQLVADGKIVLKTELQESKRKLS